MPVNVMLTFWRLGSWDRRLLLVYGAPIIAGCFCICSHVTSADVVTLTHRLNVQMGSFEWYNGPIWLLAIPVMRQIAVIRAYFSVDAVLPFLLTAAFFGAIHFAVLRRLIAASDFAGSVKGWTHPKLLWQDLLWIPFLCTVPMYVVAGDYGRWFATVVSTFTLCCARLLRVSRPVKRIPVFANVSALAVFLILPMPLSLRFPNSSPQLLTWTGTAILGRIFGPPRHPIEPQPSTPNLGLAPFPLSKTHSFSLTRC
jgi:hypothetical protein